MCIGTLFGGSKTSLTPEELDKQIRDLGGDPLGLNPIQLAKEWARLKGIKARGGSSLPFVAPPPNPAPTMGLRLPRHDAVTVGSLKLPRR